MLVSSVLLATTKISSRRASTLKRRSSSLATASAASARPWLLVLTTGLLQSCCSPVRCFSSSSSFMSPQIERSGDGTITVSPEREEDQSALVLIMHGLGDSSEGFVDVAEYLSKSLPHVKFILPTAPKQPVTMNMGMVMPSWYDIVGLDLRHNEQCKGIEESRTRIEGILTAEHEATGLSYQRMVLAGFSQGGALSLYTGLQMRSSDQRLAGIVCMSGYLPGHSKVKITPGLESMPVLHCHGTQDPTVRFEMATKTREKVLELGLQDYELKTYPIVHTVSMEEVADVKTFLNKIVPPDVSHKIKLKDPSEMSVKELKAAIRKAGLGQKAQGLMEKSEFVKLLQDFRNGKL